MRYLILDLNLAYFDMSNDVENEDIIFIEKEVTKILDWFSVYVDVPSDFRVTIDKILLFNRWKFTCTHELINKCTGSQQGEKSWIAELLENALIINLHDKINPQIIKALLEGELVYISQSLTAYSACLLRTTPKISGFQITTSIDDPPNYGFKRLADPYKYLDLFLALRAGLKQSGLDFYFSEEKPLINNKFFLDQIIPKYPEIKNSIALEMHNIGRNYSIIDFFIHWRGHTNYTYDSNKERVREENKYKELFLSEDFLFPIHEYVEFWYELSEKLEKQPNGIVPDLDFELQRKSKAQNVFEKRRNGTYKIIFAGTEIGSSNPRLKGLDYIFLIIQNGFGRDIHARDIYHGYSKSTESSLYDDSLSKSRDDKIDFIDVKTKIAIRSKRKKLVEAIKKHRNEGDIERVTKLETEKKMLEGYLNSNVGLDGKIRTTTSVDDKALRNVKKALNKIYESLQEDHPEFVNFLRKAIRNVPQTHLFFYNSAIKWELIEGFSP